MASVMCRNPAAEKEPDDACALSSPKGEQMAAEKSVAELLSQSTDLLDQLSDSEYKTQFVSVQTLLQENVTLIKQVEERQQRAEQANSPNDDEQEETARLLTRLNGNIMQIVEIYRKVSSVDSTA